MAKQKSAAPSGMSISRDRLKFTISWKIPAKGYGAGQWLWYRLHKKNAAASKWEWTDWKEINVGKKTTKKTVALDTSDYYPATSKLLNAIEFKVKGKTASDKKHTYTATSSTKVFNVSAPDAPSVSYSLDDTDANKGTFSWDTSYKSDNAKHFLRTQVQSALMENFKSDISKANFKDAAYTGASGSWVITEDGSPTQNKTFCRIVRVRARGCAGNSVWKYAYHYYSIPLRPVIQHTGSKDIGASSRYVWADWLQDAPKDRPVDAMELQYVIDTPESGEQYTGTSWNTGVVVAYHDRTVSADFNTDDGIAEDQIMWTRIRSTHDEKYAYSESCVAVRGALKAPSFDTVSATGTTLTITGLRRNTDVDDAQTAIWIKIDGEEQGIIAITNQEDTVTVSCPDVSGSAGYQVGFKNFTGKATAQNGTSGIIYKLDTLMQSKWIYSEVRDIAVAPRDISARPITSDTVELTWDWSWENANAATISWADHEDAWISTDAPTTYDVDTKEATWHVGSLETSKTYYFRVRLRDISGEEEVLSPWSNTVSASLSETPTTLTIAVSENYLSMDDTVVCSVGYTGNSKANIKIAESINDELVKKADGSIAILMMSSGMETLSETIENINKIYAASDLAGRMWNTGETHYLKAMVTATGGKEGAWSDATSVRIVAKPEIKSITTNLVSEAVTYNPEDVVTEDGEQGTSETSEIKINYLEQLPLTITPDFGTSIGTTDIKIVRNKDYYVLRPDGLKEQHFDGEVIASFTGEQNNSFTINQDDLIGYLDDGATYNIQINFTDTYDHTVSDQITFVVRWKHQPEIPEATVTMDRENRIAIVNVARPSSYEVGDSFDLYRLSADREELILQGGVYEENYVDRYPALNENGGILVVNKTFNGDYITSDNSFAWSYYDFNFLEAKTVIEFGDEMIELCYDMSLDNSWEKDFERTVYLGGAIQGDWNQAVKRDLKLSANSISLKEEGLIEKMRRLSDYPGICHIRTPDGSSFSCDIQVSETVDGNTPYIIKFSLSVSKVDTENLDGMLYAQWRAENGLE